MSRSSYERLIYVRFGLYVYWLSLPSYLGRILFSLCRCTYLISRCTAALHYKYVVLAFCIIYFLIYIVLMLLTVVIFSLFTKKWQRKPVHYYVRYLSITNKSAIFSPLSPNLTKWSNTFKQFVAWRLKG